MVEIRSENRFDLIVVGLGAVGSAALYHATCAGLKVLGIDRFDPPHDRGSSHAESRITRLAVGEGPQYLPFVARSHEIWRELETASGVDLFHQSGGYIINPAAESQDDRWGDFVDRTQVVAEQAGITFEQPTHAAIKQHVPRLRLAGNERVGYEPTGGVVMCEKAVAVQLDLARRNGSTTLVNTTVLEVEARPNGAIVHTVVGTFWAENVVVSTGPWFPELAPAVDKSTVTVTRQAVFWFDVDDPQDFGTDRFPFIIWSGKSIQEYSGVFPRPPGGRPGLKVLGEQFVESTTAETVDRQVSKHEVNDFYERLVEPRLVGVQPTISHSTVCLYTNTTDDHFLIDRHPDSAHVMFASPCSGHGFKHSTALGEAIVGTLIGAGNALSLDAFVRR